MADGMRLVQTFWTGGKNPLGEAFGWRSAEELCPCFSQTKLSLKEKENEMIRSEVAYLLFHGLVLPDSPYDSLEHIQ